MESEGVRGPEACQQPFADSEQLCVGLSWQVCALPAVSINIFSKPVACLNALFISRICIIYGATCTFVLAFLFVMELLLLSPPVASCLRAEQKPHKGLGDSGSAAVQHPLNYGSHRAGNARLMGVSGPALWHGDVRLL